MPFPFVGITTTFAVSIIPSDYRKVSSATRETGKGRMTFFTTPSRLRGEARTIVSFYKYFSIPPPTQTRIPTASTKIG